MYTMFSGFIGTYTKKESKGIYSFIFDGEYGKFLESSLAYKINNPTYLSLSTNGNFLFLVCQENTLGGIVSF